MGTNLTGTVLGCKFVGRHMLRNRSKRELPWKTKTKPGGVTEGSEEDGAGAGGGKEGEEGVVKEEVAEGVKERGVIVNVASLLAQKGVVGTSVYAAAKAGVVGKFCYFPYALYG